MRGRRGRRGRRPQGGDAPIRPLVIKLKRKLNDGDETPKSRGVVDDTQRRKGMKFSMGEEMKLVKVLLDHRKAGRVMPLHSATTTCWTELKTVLYRGESRVTPQRLYDKVRRTLRQFKRNQSEHLLHETEADRSKRIERILFDCWHMFFSPMVDDTSRRRAKPAASAAATTTSSSSTTAQHQLEKATSGNAVKVVQISNPQRSRRRNDTPAKSQTLRLLLRPPEPAPWSRPPRVSGNPSAAILAAETLSGPRAGRQIWKLLAVVESVRAPLGHRKGSTPSRKLVQLPAGWRTALIDLTCAS
ncbi:hypothetical protein AXG93_203s1230 [Marchantia polymorpha subsp. ruderalis]|uniref:Uncharacterized protein n=1 Tax=Marchantia polymorpha subsp. ruderalis TaxID=1480154 RepID=A0A176VIM2_MARPO|nr:hypothetical protein AXG93_203s1230 [Marchantia polymorpha subsp. ruderalis]